MLLGGVALFVVALLAGAAWFSPDDDSARQPQADPSPSYSASTAADKADPTGAADTTTAPVPPAAAPAAPLSGEDDGDEEEEPGDGKKARDKGGHADKGGR
jgi:hypothetical protein